MDIHNHLHAHHLGQLIQFMMLLPFLIGFILYILAVWSSNRKYKKWPFHRMVLWTTGVFLAAVAVAGPLAEKAHVDFTAHMIGHLLLGMMAPLFMALSAPMTLLLRSLKTTQARRLSKILKTRPIRFVTDPLVASFLNIGGLWLLYGTNLYTIMHQHVGLYLLVHFHVFLAGYVFTVSIISIDPTPFRTSYLYRSIILVLALAGHGILSKHIYVNPPAGVTQSQGELGAMIMYYGGDYIDAIIIFILCFQWYKGTKARKTVAIGEGLVRGGLS